MDLGQVQKIIDEIVDAKLQVLYRIIQTQREILENLISKLENLPISFNQLSQDSQNENPSTNANSFNTPIKSPLISPEKLEIYEEVVKKTIENKKKRVEDIKKKKGEDEEKKKMLIAKMKEDEIKKRAEEAKKKEEIKRRIEMEKEKKKLEEIERKKKIEEEKIKKFNEYRIKYEEEEAKKKLESAKKVEALKEKLADERKKEKKKSLPKSKSEKNINEEVENVKQAVSEEVENVKQAVSEEEIGNKIEEEKIIENPPDIEETPKEKTNEKSINPLLMTYTLDELNSKIGEILSANKIEDLNSSIEYTPSIGVKSVLNVITTLSDEKFYLDVTPESDIIWIFRVFFQFLGQTLPENPEEAWEICKVLFQILRAKSTHKQAITDLISRFNFSNENLDSIEILISGHQNMINPQFFSQSPLASLMVFFLKEILVFNGLMETKTSPPSKLYQRLIYKRTQFS